MSLSKDERTKIVRDHAKRNGGRFVAERFVDEVESAGPKHPAYAEFTWDDSKAARAHRTWQARMFAQGIKIRFTVETINADKTISIREVESPLIISPMDTRSENGGYVVFNEKNKQHRAELCSQAARDLTAWLVRYKFALAHVGVDDYAVESIIARLESGVNEPKPKPKAKAAARTSHARA